MQVAVSHEMPTNSAISSWVLPILAQQDIKIVSSASAQRMKQLERQPSEVNQEIAQLPQ